MKKQKWTADQYENVIARLRAFGSLDRRATDEVGWIALAFGISSQKAADLIVEAREWAAKREEEEA